MQEAPFSVERQAPHFPTAIQQVRSAITVQRASYALAGAFLLLAAAGGASLLAHRGIGTPSHQLHSQPAGGDDNLSQPEAPADSSSTSGTSASSGASNQSTTEINLDVNGQNVPVPENGSTSHTTTNADGSTTTVRTNSSHTSSNGSTNVKLDIHSSSSSSSGGGQP